MKRFVTSFPFAGTALWMFLAAVFCWSQSPLGLSIFAAACGALIGGVLAYLAADRNLHSFKVWIAGLLLMLGVNWLTDVFRWLTLPSVVFGGPAAYSLSDAFFWCVQSACFVFLLRFLSAARSAFISLELLAAGAVMVELFEAHRHGFINRPYAIVDPLWARGIDPLPVFLAIGAVVAILLLVLGASHSPKRGRWVDVVALVVLVGGLFLFAPLEKLRELPQPPEASQTESDEGEESGNTGQQSSGTGSEGQKNSDGVAQQQNGEGQADGGQGSGGQQGDGAQQQDGDGQQPGDGAQQQDGDGQQPGDGAQQQGGDGEQPGDGAQQQGSDGEQPGDGAQQQGSDGQQQGDGGQSSEEGQSSGQGGNSDSLTFRDAGSSSGQNPPVAVVIFRDDYTPDTGMYYFRQNAFSQYNGTKLVADTSGLYDRDVATEFPGSEPVKPEAPPLDPNLFRELETRVALLTDHAKPFALVNPTQWTAIPNPDSKRFQKAYEVKSMVLDKPIKEILGRRAGDPNWDKEVWDHYTKGPDDPRYAKLLDEIVAQFPDADKDDPLIRALMVKLWLEENCIYSLRSSHEGAKDPTASFLFGDRTGYCVFLAHAAVYLYRTAGMPARTGSGYAVEASQRGDGSSLLIPGKSAHSWPEVYIEGLGWVVLDIAPARSLDPPPQSSDQGLQQMLGEMARQDPDEKPPDPSEKKFDLQQALKNMVKALFSLLPYLLLGIVVLAYGNKIYRRFEPWISPVSALPESTLRSTLDLLADAGYRRSEGQPREVFSRELESISPSFHRLTQAHLRQRLGSPDSSPNFPWKKTFFDARAEIKKNASQVELTKGMLNPISWYWVH
jgi:protein-glutamine gamma-glutamyltransferase